MIDGLALREKKEKSSPVDLEVMHGPLVRPLWHFYMKNGSCGVYNTLQ